MHWIEYEKLLLHRDHLTEVEQQRFRELDAEDERIGNQIAGFWFPEIVGGWLVLVVLGMIVLF